MTLPAGHVRWLLLDAGNTAVKWAVMPAGKVEDPADAAGPFAASGRCLNDDDDFQSVLTEAFGQAVIAHGPLHAAWGCGVASAAVRAALDHAVHEQGIALHWLGSTSSWQLGRLRLINGYRDATQLGADRWHALIAAHAQAPEKRQVVVNAGTATTVDVLSADGRFLGGVIAPGIGLMLKSLAHGTAQLPEVTLIAPSDEAASHSTEPPPSTWADHTTAAITQGVQRAQRALVRDVTRQAFTPAGPCDRVIFTGGHGQRLADWVREADSAESPHDARISLHVDHNLVLRGIALHALSRLARPHHQRDDPHA